MNRKCFALLLALLLLHDSSIMGSFSVVQLSTGHKKHAFEFK